MMWWWWWKGEPVRVGTGMGRWGVGEIGLPEAATELRLLSESVRALGSDLREKVKEGSP